MTASCVPAQPGEIPDAYARYIRAVFPPEVLRDAPNEITGRWRHLTGPAERKFWHEQDALRTRLEAFADGLERHHARGGRSAVALAKQNMAREIRTALAGEP